MNGLRVPAFAGTSSLARHPGPRLSSAPRRKGGALRCVRGTKACGRRFPPRRLTAVLRHVGRLIPSAFDRPHGIAAVPAFRDLPDVLEEAALASADIGNLDHSARVS